MECNILAYLQDTGTKQIYSPAFGIGIVRNDFLKSNNTKDYFIVDFAESEVTFRFNSTGHIITKDLNWQSPECCIFPDKNTKWENVAPKYIININSYRFTPFEKVLVRDDNNGKWMPNFFRKYEPDAMYPYMIINGIGYRECIPYNEETKHLIFTTQNYQNHE